MPRSRGWRNSGGRDWSVTDSVKRVGAQHLEKLSPRSRRCLQRQLAGGFLPYCVQWCEFLMTIALPAVNRVSHSSHLFLHVKRAAEEGQCVTEKGISWHEILQPPCFYSSPEHGPKERYEIRWGRKQGISLFAVCFLTT